MVSVILWFVTGRQVGSRVSPPRFFVHGAIRDRAQHSNKTAIRPDDRTRERRARRFIHKRHELVREPRHGAADANPADIRTTADPIHPTALGYVAIHYRPPAADFHQAFR